MQPTNTKIIMATMAIALVLIGNDAIAAGGIDFGKAEDVGSGLVSSLRGTIATIFFSLAFVITGFLAAFNKISWGWVVGVVLGAFLVFAGPAIVANLRAAFS
jgi:type IV secretory pathway VirB2 component (pilin)